MYLTYTSSRQIFKQTLVIKKQAAIFDGQFFAAIDTFNCESKRTQIFSRPNIEVAFIFIIISNAALTTQKFVNKVGKRFFGNAVFKSK